MPRSSNQKLKLIYLQKLFIEETDENHGLTMSQIIEKLASKGINTERKSLYNDINILEYIGMDICKTRSSTVKYYLASRDFELAELKLLVDAIQSSKFITEKKSIQLIKKLESLVSCYDAKQLQRQVFVANRVKTLNEKIYYNVDKLHNAISNGKQISFIYFKWELDFNSTNKVVKVKRKNGEPYVVSPCALSWDDENYYLIAFDNISQKTKHYRVDKMENITITDDDCLFDENEKNFDVGVYSKQIFSMYGGKKEKIKLLVKNSLIGVIVDRFGTNLFIRKYDDENFIVAVDVIISPQFYAWIFGLENDVQIISPNDVKDEYINKIEMVKTLYNKT